MKSRQQTAAEPSQDAAELQQDSAIVDAALHWARAQLLREEAGRAKTAARQAVRRAESDREIEVRGRALVRAEALTTTAWHAEQDAAAALARACQPALASAVFPVGFDRERSDRACRSARCRTFSVS